MASKILVLGSLGGQIESAFAKIAKLHAKNGFSIAIVAGDLFSDPALESEESTKTVTSLLNGSISVPLPTYFTVGRYALPAKIIERLESTSGEVCENLFYLGKRSVTKTSEGIRIVTLSGALDPNIVGLSKEKYLPFYTEADAKSLYGANTADILITTAWPAGIRTGSAVQLAEGTEEPTSDVSVADLCATLKPRYHFSTSASSFYEREPFYHQPTEKDPDTRPITRFLSLASSTSASKQKWLYAFTLSPASSQPLQPPTGTTVSPFTANPRKRPFPSSDFSRFSSHDTHYSSHRHHKSKRSRPPPAPQECFFCLSNPTLATHLITSIGSDAYLTTAKGPLSKSDTFPHLGHPCHILIIPLTHAPTLAQIPEPEIQASTYAEMLHYRKALQAMIQDRGKGELGSVCWEISRAGGFHLHWQFLPVQVKMIETGLVEAAFKVEAENERYPGIKRKEIGDGAGADYDFFRVWVWRPGKKGDNAVDGDGETNGDKEKKLDGEEEFSMVLPLSAEFRFDLQFGRKVMAKLLGLEGRVDWHACSQEEEEEKVDAEAFKAGFKEFDFSLEE